MHLASRLAVVTFLGLSACSAQLNDLGLGWAGAGRAPRGTNRGRASKTQTTEADSAGGIESEGALTRRYCALLEERLADQAARLTVAEKEKDARKSLALYGQIYRDSLAVQWEVEREFNAAYKERSEQATKAGRAGTAIGYRSSDNSNNLWRSEVALAALAGGTGRMLESGIPFASTDEHGIRAPEVRLMEQTACQSARRKELHSQIEANVKAPGKAFDMNGWQPQTQALPAKQGELVKAGGELVSGGSSPTIRISTGRARYNCRPTNRVDRIEPNGVVRYQEDCERAGGWSVDLLIKVNNAAATLPSDVILQPGDQVTVMGRLVSAKVSEEKKGQSTKATHAIVVEPIVVTEVVRSRKALFSF